MADVVIRAKPAHLASGAEPSLDVPTVVKGGKHVEMVGPFVLGRTLGKGTTGKVKAGTHKDTGFEVAVKIIKKSYVKTHKAKLAREIAAMRVLSHPRVMQLYDVYETSNHLFLVLERVKGGELFDYILSKGRLPRKEALRIFAQVVEGVEYMHMHSICHRDLKPENLLLDENMNIKIADFGMAQISPGGGHLLDTFCGSPHYGAPEVVSGIRYDGRRSDVWSMGVVFYALISGMLPFDNPNISNLLRMVKRGVYHIPRFVPEDCQDLIRRLLTVDVDKRLTTPQIKHHHAFHDSAGANLFFPPEPPTSPALEAMRKHPLHGPADIDESVLRDLVGLGWGTADQLRARLLENRDTDIKNLEAVFYFSVVARNEARRERGLPDEVLTEEEPMSPAPEPLAGAAREASSPRSPASPRRHSSRSPTHAAAAVAAAVAGTAAAQPGEGSGEAAAGPAAAPRKKRPGLKITVDKGADAGAREYSTTPRFHRLKIGGDEELQSPGGPITPNPKRSWFGRFFKRRPSIDVVGKQQSNKGASGMYSRKPAKDLLDGVSRVVASVGCTLKESGASEYELKGQASCSMDEDGNVQVHDASGKVVFSAGAEQDDEAAADAEAAAAKPAAHVSAAHKTPQVIKFSIEVATEESEGVSTVNFNHRTGDLLLYRSLYTEIIRRIEL